MEALKSCYGDGSSDSDSESAPSAPTSAPPAVFTPLPPPPISLLDPSTFLGILDMQTGQTTRVRSFPHVDGNYALHVYIPINISSPSKKELSAFLKKVSSRVPNLNVVDVDVPLNILCQHDEKLEQVALGREFHISLGRTVPIRVHQIDSVISMLKQKLHIQRQYWIDFNKWEVFVNDDHTRTFLSVEVVQRGLIEDPRPHISLAWSLGDIAHSLKKVVDEEMKCAAGKCKFKGIECKIGKKAYAICKIPDEQ
ncbi:U6 snRNA phosphodiesterase Usb1 [Vigna unguiculata]|uniref:U6 snRNA phosphodiesterase 1 n=1 Tax=Vigna unguiculata TaxID=3917 RepID=A0A4D6M3J4_VIGUN|nr:U6 snRNA phosphodiesterase Usb1 [Vigna unguiculata]